MPRLSIKEQGLTYKKVRTVAIQQSEERRIQYMTEISIFHPDMLIWIDETGSDRRNSIRKYGYSLRVTPAQVFQLRVGGISAIPVMTTRGIEGVYTSTETINGEKFEEFLCQCLLPIIIPYDGVNPRSETSSLVLEPGLYSFAQVKALQRAYDSIYIASTTPELVVN